MMKIGYTKERKERTEIFLKIPFHITLNERMQHIHIIGKSGVGKSTLLENVFLQDPRGIFIDPHGLSALYILDHLPASTDVIYFNAADTQFPFAFNPLENVPRDLHPQVTDDLVSALKHSLHGEWGILLQKYMPYCIRALLEKPDGTLLEIEPLLTNRTYRTTKVLPHIKDPAVLRFWKNYDRLPEKDQQFETQSILNRVATITSDPLLRNILGQPKSKLDFPTLLKGQCMVVNLNEGAIGESNAILIGSLLVSKISTAARRRTSSTPFHILVDEVHMFGASIFSYMLSTIRKYNVSLTLVHQYLDQLSDELNSALLGAAGTIISFKVGLLSEVEDWIDERILERDALEDRE